MKKINKGDTAPRVEYNSLGGSKHYELVMYESNHLQPEDYKMNAEMKKEGNEIIFSESSLSYRKNGIVDIEGLIGLFKDIELIENFNFVKEDVIKFLKEAKKYGTIKENVEKNKNFIIL